MEKTSNWQSWQPGDDELEKLLKPGVASKLQPHHPLIKLKKNLLINTIWGMLITIAYIAIILTTPVWQVQLALVITTLFNIIILAQAIRLYRSVPADISSTESVLSILKKHHQEISAWCNMQHALSIWVYPVAATGGYIYGGVLSSGKSFEELFASPLFFWILPILVIVLVPIGLIVSKWMTRKAFGVHLDTLKQTIRALEAV